MSEPRVSLFLVLMEETGLPVSVNGSGEAITPWNDQVADQCNELYSFIEEFTPEERRDLTNEMIRRWTLFAAAGCEEGTA